MTFRHWLFNFHILSLTFYFKLDFNISTLNHWLLSLDFDFDFLILTLTLNYWLLLLDFLTLNLAVWHYDLDSMNITEFTNLWLYSNIDCYLLTFWLWLLKFDFDLYFLTLPFCLDFLSLTFWFWLFHFFTLSLTFWLELFEFDYFYFDFFSLTF